jgi:hypothetical protein
MTADPLGAADPLAPFADALASARRVQRERDDAVSRAARLAVLDLLALDMGRCCEQLREGIDDHPKNPGRFMGMSEAYNIVRAKRDEIERERR